MEQLFQSMQDFDIAIYGRVTEETIFFINHLKTIQ